ncbi:hypothetical protein IIA15_02345 [candidate division TA06 bacterium]|nr:hypothetical protein [candidate division TA06 bacterium]
MKEKGHTLTARYLGEKYGLSGWWAQAVTIRYEWERGLRNGKTLKDDGKRKRLGKGG